MPQAAREFQQMYESATDPAMQATGRETFEAMAMLQSIQQQPYTPAGGAEYPRARFGDSLQADRAIDQGGRGHGNGFRRHRRLGPPRQ